MRGAQAAGWLRGERVFQCTSLYFSGTKPNFPFVVDRDCNSICLNGDVFWIYSGGGEKGKIMHRMGGWWEKESSFSFSYHSFQ